MKRTVQVVGVAALALLVVSGAVWFVAAGGAEAQAAPRFNDGTYYVESEPDARGRQGVLEITILNGGIAGVHFDEVERNEQGDVVMSKRNNYAYADGWRRGREGDTTQLSAVPAYINQLMATGDPEAVDLVTGATSTYEVFRTLASEALEKARR